jgi:hypothetical protein
MKSTDIKGILAKGTHLQQFQIYVSVGTRILGDKYHLFPQPVSVHYTPLQITGINLIALLTRPPFTVTPISVEPSYFELVVPNDPRRSSPTDVKVEVTIRLMIGAPVEELFERGSPFKPIVNAHSSSTRNFIYIMRS